MNPEHTHALDCSAMAPLTGQLMGLSLNPLVNVSKIRWSFVRYIFVFHLKNPVASQDEFWLTFIVIWVFGFTFLTHTVVEYLPGTNPNFYYLCLGKVPKHRDFTNAKENFHLVGCLLITILLHTFAAIRYQITNTKAREEI